MRRQIFRPAIKRGMNLIKKSASYCLGPVLAPIIRYVAYTGVGSNACLRKGCLPMPVHFYSPVPDMNDLEKRKIWDKRSDLAGIDFKPQEQVELLIKMGKRYGRECGWPTNPTNDPLIFHTKNNNFSYGCAASTHSMIRYFKPRRLIEIGSGNSSLVIRSALHMNDARSQDVNTEYIIVDPFPGKPVEGGIPGVTQLIKQRVELLESKYFTQLEKNDVLFIDTSHTVRIGGDVNFLILDVLPRLSAGVIVHFHDIGLPYEYPKDYAVNPRFRMFWTEAYLLQAFLCFNNRAEILLAMAYLMTEKKKEFREAFPLYDPAEHTANSGSFWIRMKEY